MGVHGVAGFAFCSGFRGLTWSPMRPTLQGQSPFAEISLVCGGSGDALAFSL